MGVKTPPGLVFISCIVDGGIRVVTLTKVEKITGPQSGSCWKWTISICNTQMAPWTLMFADDILIYVRIGSRWKRDWTGGGMVRWEEERQKTCANERNGPDHKWVHQKDCAGRAVWKQSKQSNHAAAQFRPSVEPLCYLEDSLNFRQATTVKETTSSLMGETRYCW